MSRKDTDGVLGLTIAGLACLWGFGLAEVATYYVSEVGGVILHFVILLCLLVGSTVARNTSSRGLWLALGLVPLVRISSLTMQLLEISQIYSYLLVAVPVFAGALSVMRTLKYGWGDVGIRFSEPLVQVIIAVLGPFLGIADYLILRPEALSGNLTLQETLFPALILVVSTAFVEELVFRGVLQRAAGAIGRWGWVYIAAIYGVLQVGHGSALHVGFAFAVGLLFGWIVKTTRSILGVIVAHGLLNVGLFLIMPHLL